MQPCCRVGAIRLVVDLLPERKMSANSYEPSLADFCEIVKKYALHGLYHFDRMGSAKRNLIQARIPPMMLELNKQRLEIKFKSVGSGTPQDFDFIPMPPPESGAKFDAAFFVPRFTLGQDNTFSCAFCLLLWKDHREVNSHGKQGRTYSFRVEPIELGSHAYAHLQLSRDVDRPSLPTDLPSWMCTSYPAFPIHSSSPLRMFLTALVAIHGYNASEPTKFANAVIESAVQNANSLKTEIKGAMRAMLGDP